MSSRPLLLSMTLFILAACQTEQRVSPVPVTIPDDGERQVVVPNIAPETLEEMLKFFNMMDYSWKSLDEGIPPFVLESFPEDLDNDVQVRKKKKTFFLGLLPMVLLANQKIVEEREFLLETLARYERERTLDEKNHEELARLVRKYRLRGDPLRDHRLRTRLAKRVDIIPPALVLAQAANESAWGTSRFAKLGNNLFGQWTFKPGTGIVPEDRPAGATYEVRKFPSLFASVNSYMLNLNTHGAYLQLREIRASMRQKNKPLSGKELAKGLTRYSTRGEAYVDEIRAMIRQNRLHLVNGVALRLPSTDILNAPQVAGNGLRSTQRQIGIRLSEAWENPEI